MTIFPDYFPFPVVNNASCTIFHPPNTNGGVVSCSDGMKSLHPHSCRMSCQLSCPQPHHLSVPGLFHSSKTQLYIPQAAWYPKIWCKFIYTPAYLSHSYWSTWVTIPLFTLSNLSPLPNSSPLATWLHLPIIHVPIHLDFFPWYTLPIPLSSQFLCPSSIPPASTLTLSKIKKCWRDTVH